MSIYDHLEFRHLRYIVAIAEQRTFTAAAHSVPVAQSALSRQIAEIEEIYNIQIFERVRGGTGASLTAAGEALLMYARQLLETRTEIIEAVQAIHQSYFRFDWAFLLLSKSKLWTPFVTHTANYFPRARSGRRAPIQKTYSSVSRGAR
jgi:molybdenum-dependent DNA-binding transcriptional regulator ModE